MTARTYTYSFLSPGQTLTAPGGVFFYVKSAPDPITVTPRGATTSPRSFSNIGAGAKFGPVSTPWRYLELVSATVQSVELVVSDDGEFDLGGTVNVAGTVATTAAPSSAITTGFETVANASSNTIAADPARKRITLSNPSSSAGSVFVQTPGAGAGRGVELQAGTFLSLATTAAIGVRNDSGAAVTVTYIAE